MTEIFSRIKDSKKNDDTLIRNRKEIDLLGDENTIKYFTFNDLCDSKLIKSKINYLVHDLKVKSADKIILTKKSSNNNKAIRFDLRKHSSLFNKRISMIVEKANIRDGSDKPILNKKSLMISEDFQKNCLIKLDKSKNISNNKKGNLSHKTNNNNLNFTPKIDNLKNISNFEKGNLLHKTNNDKFNCAVSIDSSARHNSNKIYLITIENINTETSVNKRKNFNDCKSLETNSNYTTRASTKNIVTVSNNTYLENNLFLTKTNNKISENKQSESIKKYQKILEKKENLKNLIKDFNHIKEPLTEKDIKYIFRPREHFTRTKSGRPITSLTKFPLTKDSNGKYFKSNKISSILKNDCNQNIKECEIISNNTKLAIKNLTKASKETYSNLVTKYDFDKSLREESVKDFKSRKNNFYLFFSKHLDGKRAKS